MVALVAALALLGLVEEWRLYLMRGDRDRAIARANEQAVRATLAKRDELSEAAALALAGDIGRAEHAELGKLWTAMLDVTSVLMDSAKRDDAMRAKVDAFTQAHPDDWAGVARLIVEHLEATRFRGTEAKA